MDKFLIAPLESGLQTNMKAWQIMDDAFQELNNAYVFRGRVRKRFGEILTGNSSAGQPLPYYSRLAVNVGTTDGSGNLSGTAPGNIFQIGQLFTIGTEIYTVVSSAAGAQPMLDTGATTTATFNVGTGAYVFVGAPTTTVVYFYTGLPVMGLTIYEQTGTAINNQPAFAFDQEFIYKFNGNNWVAPSGTPTWHGNYLNFFWTCNWSNVTTGSKVLFITNFQVTNPNGASTGTDDPIYFTSNGTTYTSALGSNGFYFRPAGGARTSSPFVYTARIILPFKNRLILLNTIENDNSGGGNTGNNINYTNRCRYSFNGSPFANNAWYEPNQTDAAGANAAGGGYIDAPTDEQIVSAEFIKDRLIVFFQTSTWELAYTGNEILPFVWQKINTELGSEALLSSVPFDKEILTIGNVGVHACNGTNVERIDQKIPDLILDIKQHNLSIEQVDGIRDYYSELVYWNFPSAEQNYSLAMFPSRILIYNYRNRSWATADDCITTFGYSMQNTDMTWASSIPLVWEDSDFTWIDNIQAQESREVIAGNQQGFVFEIDEDVARNAPVMQITNAVASGGFVTLTIINHNLNADFDYISGNNNYILIENVNGMTGLNGNIFEVMSVTDINTVVIEATTAGTYTGGGTATRVSNIEILSKQWNPYDKEGSNVFIQKIDFAVQKTSSGQITVDYYPSSSSLSMIQAGIDSGSILGTGVLETSPYALYPLENSQQFLWHPVYFQTTGENIQIYFYLSPEQMEDPTISLQDFELEGLLLHCEKSASRLQ